VWFTQYSQLGLIKGASSLTPTTTLTEQDIVNVAEAVWDRILDDGKQARELMRLFSAALGGEASGLGELSPIYKSLSGTKSRITATVDEFGNRTSITLDLT